MKYIKLLVLVVAVSSLFASCSDENKGSTEFKTLMDSVSYSMGVQTAEFMKSEITNFNHDLYELGMKEAQDIKVDTLRKLSFKQIGEIMQSFQVSQKTNMLSGNLAVAEKFLNENKTKEGVKSTASGLQYIVLKDGSGETPLDVDTVEVHYTGTLLDGTVFDSSVQRGETIKFPLNGVIAGWTEGVQLMKVGAKYRFFIHPNLAYGERGGGQVIEPNSALIFEIELINIIKAK